MIPYENRPGPALMQERNSLPCIADPSIRGSPDRFLSLISPVTKIPSRDASPSSWGPLAEGFSKGFSKISPEMSTPAISSSLLSSASSPVSVNTLVAPAKITLPSISSLPTVTLGSDKIGNYGVMPITAPVMADSELPPNLARARLSSAQDAHPAEPASAPIPWEAHVSDTATLEPPHLPVRHKSVTPRGSSINSILGVSKRRKHGVLTTKNAVPEPLVVHASPPPRQTDVQFQMQPQIQQPHHKLHAHDHALPSIDQSTLSSRKSSNSIPELESSRWSESSGSSSLYPSPLVSPAGSQGRSPEYQPKSEDTLYTNSSMQHSLQQPTAHSRSSMYELNPSQLMVPRSHYEPMMHQHVQPPVQPLQRPPTRTRPSIPITGSSTVRSLKHTGKMNQTSPYSIISPQNNLVQSSVVHSGRVGKQPVRDPEKLKHRVWLQQNRLHQDKLHQLGFRILEGQNGAKLCSLCNSSFSKEMFVWRHAWHHVTEKPFHCTVCNQKFTRSDTLQRHVRRTGHNFDAC